MSSTFITLSAVEQIAEGITKRLLAVRDHYLPSHNGNGTEAPRCDAVAQLRRELKSGKNKAVRTLLAIGFADAEDPRIPTELVASAVDEIAEAIRAHGRALRREPAGAPSIRPLLRRVQLEQSDVALAAQDVLAEPSSVVAIDALERELIEADTANDRAIGALRVERASRRRMASV